MDKKEFAGIMKELSIVYGEKRFPLTKDILDVWYKHLSGYEFNSVERAVGKFVQESIYAPTIADIIGRVKEYEQERKRSMKECREMVEFTMDLYPGIGSRDRVMKKVGEMTDWDKAEVAKLCARIRIFVKNLEALAKDGKVIVFPCLEVLLEGWKNEPGS